MKNLNILFLVLLLIVLLIMTIGTHVTNKALQEEQTRLRNSLEHEKLNVRELRRGMAEERGLFKIEIAKSESRYDSIERVSLQKDKQFKLEIQRLKKSTVKELEDEAERIYRMHTDSIQ